MASTSRIGAIFTASTAGLTSGTREAGSALEALADKVDGLKGRLSLLTGFAGFQFLKDIAGGAISLGGGFVQMANSSRNAIENLSILAERSGTTYSAMATLELAGKKANVGIEDMANALAKADRTFINAKQGSKAAVEAFQTIGLSIDALAGLNTVDRFRTIAEAIGGMSDGAARTAASMEIFGRSGAGLSDLFANIATSIGDADRKATAFGAKLSDIQVTGVLEMNDAFDEAAFAIESVTRQVVANLAPAVKSIVEDFNGFIAAAGGAHIGDLIAQSIKSGAEVLAPVGDAFVTGLMSAWDRGAEVARAFESAMSALTRTGATVQGMAQFIPTLWTGLEASVTDAVGEAGKGLQWLFGNQGNEYAEKWNADMDDLRAHLWERFEGWNKAQGDNFKIAAGQIVEGAGKGAYTGITDALKNVLGAGDKGGIAEEARKAAAEIKDALPPISDWFATPLKDALAAIPDFPEMGAMLGERVGVQMKAAAAQIIDIAKLSGIARDSAAGVNAIVDALNYGKTSNAAESAMLEAQREANQWLAKIANADANPVVVQMAPGLS